MATDDEPPRPGPLKRQQSQNSQQREKELLDWVVQRCNSEDAIGLEEVALRSVPVFAKS